jgi:bacillolysin
MTLLGTDIHGGVFLPLSLDADVVAHELTHGITQFSSDLVYAYKSGALNEAISDIFGARVDRQEGATDDDIWLLGEDIYTSGIPGDALRNMADPESRGDYDYYPTRYKRDEDYGGVHSKSGIANLAFYFFVEGGSQTP